MGREVREMVVEKVEMVGEKVEVLDLMQVP